MVLGLLTAAVGVAMIIYPLATATASTLFCRIGAHRRGSRADRASRSARRRRASSFSPFWSASSTASPAWPWSQSPGIGVVTLTAVLGAMLIGESIVETVVAFSLPAEAGRGGFLVNALFSLALGMMILSQWPSSSIWAIGTLVGVAVFWNGITRTVISGKIKHDVGALSAAA